MEIEDLIEQVSSNKGIYSSSITIPLNHFKLNFKGVGNIAFPLSSETSKKLIAKGEAAPFGWRDQTIKDKSVRDCWEIDPKHFSMGLKWNDSLNYIIGKMQKSLGLEDGELKAHLYKMLIYEKNQFFHPHQDSEKFDGMIATLIIVLPSEHQGGDITISHHNQKVIYKTDKNSLDSIQAISFYADCHHEVSPIKNGHRVVLTYNLVFKRNIDEKLFIENRIQKNLDAKMEAWFKDYFKQDKKDVEKFVYLLDYQYTQISLCLSSLKGNDFLRVRALMRVCKKLNYEFALSLADIHEVWSCEDRYDSYRNQRSKRYNYDYDDENDDEGEEGEISSNKQDYSLEELVDHHIELKYLKFLKANEGGYGDEENLALESLNVGPNEIFMTMATDKFRPFSSEFEGWMGNYGNTLDRWYHRAAITIWPREYSPILLFKSSPAFYLKKMEEKLKDEANLQKAKLELQCFIKNEIRLDYEFKKEINTTAAFMSLLLILKKMNDHRLTEEYLNFISKEKLEEDEWEILCDISELHGKAWCEVFLSSWIIKNKLLLNFESFSFCCQYASLIKGTSFLGVFFYSLFDKVLSYQMDHVKNILKSQLKSMKKRNEETIPQNVYLCFECIVALRKSQSELNQKIVLEKLLELSDYAFGKKSLLNPSLQFKTYEKLINSPMRDDLNELNLKLIKENIMKNLKLKLVEYKRDPNDWSIPNDLKCSCTDCKILISFLNGKKEIETVLPLNQERRRHIHNQIGVNELDVSHETLRRGSPYVLNLKKLPSLFKNDEIELKKIQDFIDKLAII